MVRKLMCIVSKLIVDVLFRLVNVVTVMINLNDLPYVFVSLA